MFGPVKIWLVLFLVPSLRHTHRNSIGITEWTPRDLTIDLSALKKNGAKATLFKDGANADRKGTDYKKVSVSIPADGKMTVHMAPGGGFAMTID